MDLAEALERIATLEAENRELRERLEALERRLSLNSTNSSKPPSSEGFQKAARRTQSLRPKGQRRSGGQPGHPGQTLEMVLHPDEVIEHAAPEVCGQCGDGMQAEPVRMVLKRQVFDIPAPLPQVTEHQVKVKVCPGCQQRVQGQFPAGVSAPVQYGGRIRAVALYLHHYPFIPEDRLSELLAALYGCSLSPATLATLSAIACEALQPVVTELADQLATAPVKHLDETGCRVEGHRHWLHVVSTATTTWYRRCVRRKDLEPLQGFGGVVVHDHWQAYFQLDGVEHALCNAHHLRELKALAELDQESWAQRLSQLLQVACRYHHRYPTGVPLALQQRIRALYHRIVARGLAFHQAQEPLPQPPQRGRPKRRIGHNFLLRMQQFDEVVLRFLRQPIVPFSNNQAERDLRMMKLKQKISGGFRSVQGAETFMTIRSVLSTAQKRGLNLLDVLATAVQGKTPTVFST